MTFHPRTNIAAPRRRLALILGAAAVAACSQHAAPSASPSPESTSRDDTPLACVHSDTGVHRLAVNTSSARADGRVGGIIRGTDHELVRDASVITLHAIDGSATLRARGDSSGRFVISNVAPGAYELRVVSIGYQTSRDTVVVPREGLSVEITQVIMRFLDEEALCGYLAAIDAEPVLVLSRTVTTSVTHALPDGGSVRTTFIARPTVDGVSLELLLRNVGTAPAGVTRLCYPVVAARPVRQPPGAVGPACYGTGVTLAPGDTIAVHQSAQLRGAPGTYSFRFHAADPPVLDAVVPLTLERGRSRR